MDAKDEITNVSEVCEGSVPTIKFPRPNDVQVNNNINSDILNHKNSRDTEQLGDIQKYNDVDDSPLTLGSFIGGAANIGVTVLKAVAGKAKTVMTNSVKKVAALYEKSVEKTNAYQGIHPLERKIFWFKVSADKMHHKEDPDLEFHLNLFSDELVLDQINKDIERTRFETNEYEVLRSDLKVVLMAISVFDKDVSYVQGMNYLAGFMLINGLSPSESFQLLARLLTQRRYNLKDLFGEGMPQIQSLTDFFFEMMEIYLPDIYAHIKYLNYKQLEILFLKHWITLFSQTDILTYSQKQKLWDIYLVEGWTTIILLSLAILEPREKTILDCKNGEDLDAFFFPLLNTFCNLKPSQPEPHDYFGLMGRYLQSIQSHDFKSLFFDLWFD